ncbi:MAG: transporter substrate-binding domain-containing protein [Clostridia bacterium]|nr:transporter substrate-binding domain-containing protein [Clostridia bacterium]
MKKFTKVLALVLAVVFVVAAFAACGGKGDTIESGKLIMATNAAFPPYEFLGEDGKIVGIDAEIAQLIADELKLELVIEDIEFGSIITGVQSGKYDIGMAGMTVTPERLENVNFSTSYANGVQVVIVKEDFAIKSIDDLEGKMIGVQEGTTGHIYCADTPENGGYGEDNVTAYSKGADAVQALVAGKVDCVVIDREPAKEFVKANEGLTILATEFTNEDYAIAVSKDNPELLEKINAALAKLEEEGKIDEIVNKYIPVNE